MMVKPPESCLHGGHAGRQLMSVRGEHIVQFDRRDTGVVFIDPQNDVLRETRAAWGAVGQSVRENKTVRATSVRCGPARAVVLLPNPHQLRGQDGSELMGSVERTRVTERP